MRSSFLLLMVMMTLAAATGLSSRALAHGTSIQVTVVDNSLSVSGGLADSAGFAPMIFVEDDEDGDFFVQTSLPGFGPSTIWQIPGYDISGLDEHSGLFLDVISRPVATSNPVEYRSLWYASPTTQRVATTPAAYPFQIRKSTSVNVTLSPTDGSDPPPIQIAAPLASDMGSDKHLVAYALSEPESQPPSPSGAYGFFARLTSNQYGPSEPFLIVVNNIVSDYTKMVPAALAINAAAFLPGDYNHDERVDASDYVVWRKTFGSTTALAADGSGNQQVDEADFDVWRLNFGTSIAGSGLAISEVPEPNGWNLMVVGVVGYLLALSVRTRNRPAISFRRASS